MVVMTALAVVVVRVPVCMHMAHRPQVQGGQGGLRRKVGLHALLQIGLGVRECTRRGGKGYQKGNLSTDALEAKASCGKRPASMCPQVGSFPGLERQELHL